MSNITQEQVDEINRRSAGTLITLLTRIDESENRDSEMLQLVSETYGAMVALSTLGYKVIDIAKDAELAAVRLEKIVGEVADDT